MKTNQKSILIVERESEWVDFFSHSLHTNGFNYQTVARIAEAVSFLNSDSGRNIDLILVDASLADKSDAGKTSLGLLIHSARQTRKPVIVLFAAEPTPESLRDFFQLGVNDCVRKPFTEDSLLMIIDQALARSWLDKIHPSPQRVRSNSVLIVDDDDEWLATMVNNLPSLEHVEIATDYRTALEKINKREFSLVISDLRLNDADDRDLRGMELIQNIRKQDDASRRFTPIIIVSAYGTPKLIRDSYNKYQVSIFFDKKYMSLSKYKDSVLGVLDIDADRAKKGLG